MAKTYLAMAQREDESKIRTATMQDLTPIMMAHLGAEDVLRAIKLIQGCDMQVCALQEYH